MEIAKLPNEFWDITPFKNDTYFTTIFVSNSLLLLPKGPFAYSLLGCHIQKRTKIKVNRYLGVARSSKMADIGNKVKNYF